MNRIAWCVAVLMGCASHHVEPMAGDASDETSADGGALLADAAGPDAFVEADAGREAPVEPIADAGHDGAAEPASSRHCSARIGDYVLLYNAAIYSDGSVIVYCSVKTLGVFNWLNGTPDLRCSLLAADGERWVFETVDGETIANGPGASGVQMGCD